MNNRETMSWWVVLAVITGLILGAVIGAVQVLAAEAEAAPILREGLYRDMTLCEAVKIEREYIVAIRNSNKKSGDFPKDVYARWITIPYSSKVIWEARQDPGRKDKDYPGWVGTGECPRKDNANG